MKPKFLKTNRGYIGLIALLVGVAVIAYLMIVQYQRVGPVQPKVESGDDTESISDTGYLAPIERAQDVKNILESRNRID